MSLHPLPSSVDLRPKLPSPPFQGDTILKTRLLMIHGVIMGRVMAIVSQAQLTIAIRGVAFFSGSITIAKAVLYAC